MHRSLLASLTTVLGDRDTQAGASTRPFPFFRDALAAPVAETAKGAVPSEISDTAEPRLPIRTETGTLTLLTVKSAWPPKGNGRASSALLHTAKVRTRTDPRQSFSKAEVPTGGMFLREHGKELGWVSSFVCALDGGESSLPNRNRFFNGLLTRISPLMFRVVPSPG